MWVHPVHRGGRRGTGQTKPLSSHSLFLPGEGDGSNVGFMYMQNYAPGGAVHAVFNETVRLIRAGLRKGPGSSIFNQNLFNAALMQGVQNMRCVGLGPSSAYASTTAQDR
jgi:hypothetical protein